MRHSSNGPGSERLYRQALESLYKTARDFDAAATDEREPLARELDQINELIAKLESGRVDIVLLGEISTGKSALINALSGQNLAEVGVQGGVTRTARRITWDTHTYRVAGMGMSSVELIDTPGINEVEGGRRAELACQEAGMADLVLFVTDSDLNNEELAVFRQLIDVHKPIILVLNKADLYSSSELMELKTALKRHVEGLLPPGSIVTTSADPAPLLHVIESPGGDVHHEYMKPPPSVDELRLKILEILEREGKELIALNSALFAARASDRLRATKVRMRDARARKVIIHFCVIKGAAVAMNPVPVADVLGGFGSDAAMVAALGRIYGEEISLSSAGSLAVGIAKSAGWTALAEWGTHAAAHFIKAATMGAGTLLTALPQGMAAAYGSYLVGEASRYYFEHDCGWGGSSPRSVLKQIARNADRESVLSDIRKELLCRLEARTGLPDVRAVGQGILKHIRRKITG